MIFLISDDDSVIDSKSMKCGKIDDSSRIIGLLTTLACWQRWLAESTWNKTTYVTMFLS